MYLNFKVTNNGSSEIPLTDIRLRYYFTDDGVSPIVVFVDYAHNNGMQINNNITYTIQDINCTGANKYIELGFNTAAGSLAPNTYAIVRARAYQKDYSQNFTQTNDYSFCKKNTDFAAWDKVTGYLDGVLISGTEPAVSGSTPNLTTPTPQTSLIPVPSNTPTSKTTPTPSNSETPVDWSGQSVPNGNFEAGTIFWSFYCDSASGAKASNLVHTEPSGNKISKVSIENVGPNLWTIHLKHTGIELENSKTYRLTFEAKSTIPRNIRISLQNATSSLIEYFGSIVKVDSKMKTYTCEFTLNSSTGTNVAIVFELGNLSEVKNQPHDIFFDNVSIEKIGSPSSAHIPAEDTMVAGITASMSSEYDVELGKEAEILLSQSGEITLEGRIENEKEVVLVLDNSGVLNTYMEEILTPLDFGIYSNLDLTVQGKDAFINGSVHTNGVFTSNVETVKITETCSAAGFNITSKNANINTYKNITMPVEMPYFHDSLIADASKNSMVFRPEDYPPSMFFYPMPGQQDIFIYYNYFANRFEIWGMGTLVISSSMYFKGNVFISLRGTSNIGEGFIVADGDITIQGENLSPQGPNDKLYVYSIGGNIEFQTPNSTINGIAYAPGSPEKPNSGKIIFTGNNNTVNGSIAGNELKFYGSGLTVNHTEGQFTVVEQKYLQSTTYMKLVKDTAKSFVDKFAGTRTKMTVIQYSDSANNNDFKQYDLAVGNNAATLKDKIEKIKPETSGLSNMGDGMRRAYHILKKPKKDSVSKYIIVLAGSEPNRWTGMNPTSNDPKTGDGKADHIKADNGAYNSLNYAKDIGKMITSDGINLMFISFSDKDIDSVLEEIAVESGSKLIESTGRHYYRADNLMELLEIFGSMHFKILYDVVLEKVVFEEILPQGVMAIDLPDWMSTESITAGGTTRTKIVGEINSIPLTFTGKGYSFDIDSFKIKVKYMKPGTIVFGREDSKMIYSFEYMDTGGKVHSKTLDKYFNEMTVNVTMTIDIN